MNRNEAEELYKELIQKNPQTQDRHNHSQLFDWEVEACSRIVEAIKGDKEAQAFFGHTLSYALMQSNCVMRGR